MGKELISILLSVFLLVTIFGQEKENNIFLRRGQRSFFLGGEIGLSMYNGNCLNNHFKDESELYEYGFECVMVPGVFGEFSVSFALNPKNDLSIYTEIISGTDWCLFRGRNSFQIYSPGFEIKRYFPFWWGRYLIFGALCAKFSSFKFVTMSHLRGCKDENRNEYIS